MFTLNVFETENFVKDYDHSSRQLHENKDIVKYTYILNIVLTMSQNLKKKCNFHKEMKKKS